MGGDGGGLNDSNETGGLQSMKRHLAYITAPWEDDPVANAEQAVRYCRAVYEAGYAPSAPRCFCRAFSVILCPRSIKTVLT